MTETSAFERIAAILDKHIVLQPHPHDDDCFHVVGFDQAAREIVAGLSTLRTETLEEAARIVEARSVEIAAYEKQCAGDRSWSNPAEPFATEIATAIRSLKGSSQ